MKAGNADALMAVDEYYPAWQVPSSVINIDRGKVSVNYYNLQGVRIARPQKGPYIEVITQRDGNSYSRTIMRR